jgi:homopolymeric O-antigen transport system ATP-binding protein
LNGTILGMKKAEIDRKFDEIVAFSEIEKFLDTPVKRYSSGMYVRLAFAVAAHLDPEILLVDEILAVGDAAFQKKCLAKIGEVSKAGRTVLFVSHNMAAVERLCSRAIVLRDGRLADDQAAPAAVVGYLQVAGMTEDNGLAYQVRRELLSAHVDPDMRFTAIELMTVSEAPLRHCGTGDSILIRMHYEASRQFASQAFAIHARNHLGQSVFRLNTTPISGYPIERLASRGYVDLVLDSLPLTAGRYYFDIGFVRERTEWIIKLEDVVVLNVDLNDVYGGGMAIDSSRGMIVVSHRWHHYDANNERELTPSAPGRKGAA